MALKGTVNYVKAVTQKHHLRFLNAYVNGSLLPEMGSLTQLLPPSTLLSSLLNTGINICCSPEEAGRLALQSEEVKPLQNKQNNQQISRECGTICHG